MGCKKPITYSIKLAEVGVFGGTSISFTEEMDCNEKSKFSLGDNIPAKLSRLAKFGTSVEI